jgi:uncharacterized protein YxjI
MWCRLELRRSGEGHDHRIVRDAAGAVVYRVLGRAGSARGTITLLDADEHPVATVRQQLARRHTAVVDRSGRPVVAVRWSSMSGSRRLRVTVPDDVDLRIRGDLRSERATIERNRVPEVYVSSVGEDEYDIDLEPDSDSLLAVAVVVAADLLAH